MFIHSYDVLELLQLLSLTPDVLTKTVARALRIGNSKELWRVLLPHRHSSLNWKSIFNSVTKEL
jgi:hypothetical protein